MESYPDKPSHLIFLDIDGVLRPVGAYDGMLQKKPIAHVKAIARAFDSRIVITSTWRDIMSWETFNKAEIFGGLVIGETPDLDPLHRDNGRYREVLDWLKRTGNEDVPWIALDDKRDHYPDLPNVFMTNPETGIDQALVDRILKRSLAPAEGKDSSSAELIKLLGDDLHQKVSSYAQTRGLTIQTAVRQLATAGLFVITE